MTENEFAIIEHYFKSIFDASPGVDLGPGDDCAVISLPDDSQLCLSTDTLVEGVHFLPGASAELVAARTLAANLSDLAAMGARPHSFLLAITMPDTDEHWLKAFSSALKQLSRHYGVPLIGGNLSQGQLALTITITGTVPLGQAVQRDGARAGDEIYVTGTLGDAAGGLAQLRAGETQGYLVSRYAAPTPRLEAGERLRQIAHAMIDISDGLVADLGHICKASGVGALIDSTQLPLTKELRAFAGQERAPRLALFAGDDYELCFTAAEADAERIMALAAELSLPMTRIGSITGNGEVVVLDENSEAIINDRTGYQHF